jgi:ABC-2 type transport system ATP-binding protein
MKALDMYRIAVECRRLFQPGRFQRSGLGQCAECLRAPGRKQSPVQYPANAKRHLGYACAPENLPPLLTARQCFEVHAGAKGLPTVDGELMSLAEELKFLPYLEAFVDTLSLGTKQKLAVLLCLIGDPKLIILDEAFNGLDPASSLVLKRHLRWRLKHRGAALVLATHALDIVERYADHAGLLLDGTLTREWTKSDIEKLRSDGRSFDSALADTRSDIS